MTYQEWFNAHGKKHATIMKKLEHLNEQQILEYFRFENMVEKERDFCLLYATKTKCHDTENLNCYLCACPHFRFNDNGIETIDNKTLYSTCSIHAKDGGTFVSENALHHDCTRCLIPHQETALGKNLNRNWFDIMKEVPLIG